MLHLADLLASIPLPELQEGPPLVPGSLPHSPLQPCAEDDPSLVHDLGGDLPAGHVHVWGGPSGAGKTAFLLCLLRSAAASGRRVVYATYELAPESLALRLLAKASGLDLAALPDPGGKAADCTLAPEDVARAHAAREALAALPFDILPARGFTAASLGDRLVRMPFRPEVLAVDYLQGVVRNLYEDEAHADRAHADRAHADRAHEDRAHEAGAAAGQASAATTPEGASLGRTLRALADMASHLHLAVICAVRAADTAGGGLEHPGLNEALLSGLGSQGRPDRIGWIGGETNEPSDARRAEVLRNRHGGASSVPLRLDGATGAFERA